MPWPKEQLQNEISAKFLSNFKLREKLEMLLDLRKDLRNYLNQDKVKMLMRNDGDVKSLEFVIEIEAPDSEQTELLEILGSDAADFFFGCPISAMTEKEMTEARALYPKGH